MKNKAVKMCSNAMLSVTGQLRRPWAEWNSEVNQVNQRIRRYQHENNRPTDG